MSGQSHYDPVRRGVVLGFSGILLRSRLFAASDFWNRKTSDQWSEQELDTIQNRSPWAKEVNVDFETDRDYTTGAADGPSVGRGGMIGAPGQNQPQIELGKNSDGSQRGARRSAPVIVRWESAQPMLDARGAPLPPEFKDRYVIAVTSLPLGVMERKQSAISADPLDNTPAARQRRMTEALQAAAYLEARGREPVQPGIVQPAGRYASSGAGSTYWFGFSRDLMPLTPQDRDVQFTLKTAYISLRAKFQPKEMLYRGKLVL
jgi:hypothetical protein